MLWLNALHLGCVCVCVYRAQGSAPYVSTTHESNTDCWLPGQLLILFIFEFQVLSLSFPFITVIFYPSPYLALIGISHSLWFLYDAITFLRCF